MKGRFARYRGIGLWADVLRRRLFPERKFIQENTKTDSASGQGQRRGCLDEDMSEAEMAKDGFYKRRASILKSFASTSTLHFYSPHFIRRKPSRSNNSNSRRRSCSNLPETIKMHAKQSTPSGPLPRSQNPNPQHPHRDSKRADIHPVGRHHHFARVDVVGPAEPDSEHRVRKAGGTVRRDGADGKKEEGGRGGEMCGRF